VIHEGSQPVAARLGAAVGLDVVGACVGGSVEVNVGPAVGLADGFKLEGCTEGFLVGAKEGAVGFAVGLVGLAVGLVGLAVGAVGLGEGAVGFAVGFAVGYD